MIRWLVRLSLLLLALFGIAVLAAWLLLRGSLPRLDGDLTLRGLSAPVNVQRDRLGVVTIDAASETDAMRALGYVHAQERYFEMDLARRSAAGELAQLFGPIALDLDMQHRVHRMRTRVMEHLDAIARDNVPQLRAYTDGVNAGLQALRVRPWPYLLLGQQPEPWTLADSALAGYAMYFDLQDDRNRNELALWRIQQHIPPALFALLTRDGTRWDAPLMGKARGDAVLPGVDELDLRTLPMPAAAAGENQQAPFVGSNNFAVSGALTADGRAIVADDMHLGLRAPNLWFRARLHYPDARATDDSVDVQGFTLPGLPAVVVGSNGHIAWGFTNGYADNADWASVRPCVSQASTETDCTRVTTHREVIHVAGGDDVAFDVEETSWGPILQREPQGRALVLRWSAQLPGSINFSIAGFAYARDLDAALRIADRTAIPAQNLLIVDSTGRIAWRLLGPLPERGGSCSTSTLVETRTGVLPQVKIADQRTPDLHASPAQEQGDRVQPCPPWTIASDTAPSVIDPASGRLWTANNRVVDGDTLARLGDAGYALGARAKQIRDNLFAKDRFDERDLLAIQLDDRALFLEPWWRQLAAEAHRTKLPALRALATAADTWQGHASVDSTSYRIVRAWRNAVLDRISDGLTAPARAALGDAFVMPSLPQLEGVAWPMLAQRPAHLLPRRYAACTTRAADSRTATICQGTSGWDALLEDAAAEVRDGLVAQGPLAERTWGERNTARICHPLADAIPLFGKRLLCMPPEQLAGDSNMPRVAAPAFGASERMVVSPGHEADGIIHMPGGQSGHPLSPFWGAGHDDWVIGRATSFLPGETTHVLKMSPASRHR